MIYNLKVILVWQDKMTLSYHYQFTEYEKITYIIENHLTHKDTVIETWVSYEDVSRNRTTRK